MNYHSDSSLNERLKKMKEDVEWKKEGQENVKRQLLLSIEQPRNARKARGMKGKLSIVISILVMIGIGVAVILYANQAPDNQLVSPGENAQVKATEVTFEYGISEDIQDDIREIIESGFDLKLPALSITDDMGIEMLSSVKREGKEERVEVNTVFSFQGKKQFILTQEFIGQYGGELVNNRNDRIKEMAVETVNINGIQAYITENKNGKSLNSKSLYLLTDQFGFSIHSNDLSNEQMIRLMDSMDIGK